jgi:hypothetical protein
MKCHRRSAPRPITNPVAANPWRVLVFGSVPRAGADSTPRRLHARLFVTSANEVGGSGRAYPGRACLISRRAEPAVLVLRAWNEREHQRKTARLSAKFGGACMGACEDSSRMDRPSLPSSKVAVVIQKQLKRFVNSKERFKFIHGMLIRSARLEGCKAVKDGHLGLVEFGQGGAIRTPGLLSIRTLHEGAASHAAFSDLHVQRPAASAGG